MDQIKLFQRLRQQDLSEDKMNTSCFCMEEKGCAKKPTIFTKQETFKKRFLQIGNGKKKSLRIVNGFDTEGALPYQLRIKYKKPCGGILISSRFGLTADHCISTKYLKEAIVWAGAYKDPARPTGSSNVNVQSRGIKKIYGDTPGLEANVHNGIPDMVVIEFDEPFDLKHGVIEPACFRLKKFLLGRRVIPLVGEHLLLATTLLSICKLLIFTFQIFKSVLRRTKTLHGRGQSLSI